MVPLADQLLYSRLTSNSSLLYSPGIDTRRKSIAEVASYSNYFSVSTALEISSRFVDAFDKWRVDLKKIRSISTIIISI